MKISKLATDVDAEKHGRWVDTGIDGLRLLVARMNNPAFLAALQRVTKAAAEAGQSALMADGSSEDFEVTQRLAVEAMSTSILLGWEHLEDENDVAVEFSPERALEYLSKYPDFHRLVLMVASNRDNFLIVHEKEAAENSPPSSDGS